MNLVKSLIATMVLLIGILLSMAGIQALDTKAFRMDTAKPVRHRVVVETGRINIAGALDQGSPSAPSSCSCRVAYFNSEQVLAAATPDSQATQNSVKDFLRGDLFDWDASENKYQVRMTRQEGGDRGPQIHTWRHVIYALEGSATFITGGRLVGGGDPSPATPSRRDTPGPRSINGTNIEGGETRLVSKGDLVIVPKDTPHWWKGVTSPPFIYIAMNFVGAQSHDFSPDPGVVTYFDSKKVEAGFANGATRPDGSGGTVLFDGKGVGDKYQVSTESLNGGPWQAEVHSLDTEVLYVKEGSATFVTGGTVVGPKTTAPNEIRGNAIAGGVTRPFSKGDMLIVPNGTPIWFKEAHGPFLYLLVKIR